MTSATNPYQTAVLKASNRLLKRVVDPFIASLDVGKKAVILLPGGAASALYHSDKPFDPKLDVGEYDFEKGEVWLTPGILIGDAKRLPISKNDRDLSDYLIVADGDIQWFEKPYLQAMRFFSANFPAVLLGWDWRRDIMTAVDMLKDVITKIEARKGQEVLKNVFLVGHSMGGMVAKLFFSTNEDLASKIGGMITVGTPFYGYLGQLRRVFEGEKILNDIYTAKGVAKIYSSFTGLYTLFPIDYDTYLRDGTALTLNSYPVNDPNGSPADPYHKTTSYPKWGVRLWLDELSKALSVVKKLANPVRDDLREKVHHIRALMHEDTPVAAIWDQKLPDPYEPPTSPSPIHIGPKELGEGDEVIPHWSARLASTPKQNVHDFTTGKGEHMTLMAQDYVLRCIQEIVTEKPSLTADKFFAEYGPNPQMATPKELKDFMDTVLPKIRLASRNLKRLSSRHLEREIATLIPDKYLWRILQDISV